MFLSSATNTRHVIWITCATRMYHYLRLLHLNDSSFPWFCYKQLPYFFFYVYLLYSSVSSSFNTAILVHFIYNCIYSSLFTSINTSFIITAILLHLLLLFTSIILLLFNTSVVKQYFYFCHISSFSLIKNQLQILLPKKQLWMMFFRTNLHVFI